MSSEKLKEAMESISVTLRTIQGMLESKGSLDDEKRTVAMLKRINVELKTQLEWIQGEVTLKTVKSPDGR